MLSQTTIFQIACFVRVADAGSFFEAGRRLGMTISAVSKAVKRFETQHGVRLLHRSTHSLSLTAEGEALLGEARDIHDGLHRFEAALSQATGGDGAGIVRVSAPPGFARACLLPVLPALAKAHPEIRLDLKAGYRVVDLADEGVDLAIRGGTLDGVPGQVGQRLFSFSWRAYAATGYLSARGAPGSIDDLGGHRLIGFRGGGRLAPWRFRDPTTGRVATALRREEDAAVSFDDGSLAYEAARIGGGIVLVPEWLAWTDLADGRVTEVLPDWRLDETSTMSVLRLGRRVPRRTTAVLSFLREAAREWAARAAAVDASGIPARV